MLFSPLQPEVLLLKFLVKDIPYAKAEPIVVKVLTRSLGRRDCYFGNIIKVYLGFLEEIRKYTESVPPALHVSMRPLASGELVPRKETLYLLKLKAEGTLSKMMVVLGWWLHSLCLLLRLSEDKSIVYSKEVKEILNEGKVNKKGL